MVTGCPAATVGAAAAEMSNRAISAGVSGAGRVSVEGCSVPVGDGKVVGCSVEGARISTEADSPCGSTLSNGGSRRGANSGAMAEMLYRGGDRPRLGNAIWGALGRDFESRDSKRFMVAVLTPNQWNAMVGALEIAEPIAALEAETGVEFARSDHNRFVHREALFAIVQEAASRLDYADLAERLTKAGATFERYRTMFEAANDPVLVAENPLFGPSPANPSGFAYPAARSFAHLGGQPAADPAPAPYLGQHSEEVLSERLGLSSGVVGDLIDRGVIAPSDQINFRKKA